ncbi:MULTISPECIES: GNAT family N-acetyltransferase [unclassified Pseudofrankia]|uniref:GNAT family N-acetyltransferase n=1 Tax=unclassified Pseudofrankia TaxID=2994372 RepID=UPI0008DA8608|nr:MULTISPECIES: GNAT family N-acetyltransferase [unclassified Pseudofrankia]MDT3445550.1 GNAT family N-acetyltransferase [Pseudofrankia sp. BMG5.37]OHV44331.1 GCN5 family acetyltransferase [Pseudofrankia sp. BMG5.36]
MSARGDAVSSGREPVATDPLVAPRRFTDLADPAADAALTHTTGFADRAALAAHLEVLAFRGWPALRTQTLDGWVLRDSAGATRRGNSVWTCGDVADAAAAIAEAERFYARAGRPSTFQLTPVSRPEGLGVALDTAGYDDDSGPTDVCVADLAVLIAGVAGIAEYAAGRTRPGTAVRTWQDDAPDESWLDVGAAGGMSMFGPYRPASVAILSQITLPVVYVTAALDGRPVGVGRGVVDGEWLGIYSMATLPAARGRGAATAVLAALARWSAALGARRAYLQVEERSAAARRLYAALGFLPVYRYTYRRRPAAPMRPA